MDYEEILEEAQQACQTEEGKRIVAEVVERYQNMSDSEKVLELKEQDIMKVLKVSYIAERFFGRSRSWICHKLNHDLKNGKPDDFTPQERQKLKEALDIIAWEIQMLADDM